MNAKRKPGEDFQEYKKRRRVLDRRRKLQSKGKMFWDNAKEHKHYTKSLRDGT